MKLVRLSDFMWVDKPVHDRLLKRMRDEEERNFIFISNSPQCETKRKEIAAAVGLKLVKTFRYNNAGHSTLPWKGPSPKPDWITRSDKEYREMILKNPSSRNYLTFYAMEKR